MKVIYKGPAKEVATAYGAAVKGETLTVPDDIGQLLVEVNPRIWEAAETKPKTRKKENKE